MKRTKHFKSTKVHVLHNEEFKEKGGKERKGKKEKNFRLPK